MSDEVRVLESVERSAFAALLPDTPESLITKSLLAEGALRLLACADAVLATASPLEPDEPMAFGSNPAAIVATLHAAPDWRAVSVVPRAADEVARLLHESGVNTRAVRDIYFSRGPEPAVTPPANARLLNRNDSLLLAAHQTALDAVLPGITRESPIRAATIIDGAIVSFGSVNARTARHANLAVATLPEWRGNGYGTAVAMVLAHAVLQTKRRPVWSSAETNLPSLAIARRLAFEETTERVYLIRD